MLRNIIEYMVGFSLALIFCLMLAYAFLFDTLPTCLAI